MSREKGAFDDTKTAILETAERIFAEKGFDGARVDEIARKAGTNKALIYYYFDSKEKLLQQIIRTHIEEILEYRKKLWEKDKEYLAGEISAEELQKTLEGDLGEYFSFFREKSKILQIILLELLKMEPKSEKILHELLTELIEDVERRLEWLDIKFEDRDYLQTVVFFYGLLPIMAFFSMQERWAKHTGLDLKEVEEKFIKASVNVYAGYFLPLKNK